MFRVFKKERERDTERDRDTDTDTERERVSNLVFYAQSTSSYIRAMTGGE